MTVLLLEWVCTSMFLILTVLALRVAFGRRVSACLRYGLWAVVLARLLVPVQLFTSPIAGTRVFTGETVQQNAYRVTDDGFEKGGPDDVLSLGAPDGPSAVLPTFPEAPVVPDPPSAPEPPAAPDLTQAPIWLGWMWLGGSAAMALVLLVSNLRFDRRLRRCRARLEGAECPLPVYVAVGLPSPCLLGLLHPAVYVTPETAADPDMLRHVLAHEYTHFRHGDHIWSFLRCVALAVHWWNPLVWLAVTLSRRDGELACDEGALKRLGDGERQAYGNTLLALVTAKPQAGDLLRFATTMAGEKRSLRERIGRIAQAPRRWLWAAVAVVLVTALACVCAFGQAEEEPEDGPHPSPTPSAAVNTQEPGPMSRLYADLLGGAPFYSVDAGKMLTLDTMDEAADPYGYGYEVTQYAMVDLDGDGAQELLLWIEQQGVHMSYLIFHEKDGAVYAYGAGYKEMQSIKTDGTFYNRYIAVGEGIGVGYATASFTETGIEYTPFTYDLSLPSREDGVDYYLIVVDGQPADGQAYSAAEAAQEQKEQVVWLPWMEESGEGDGETRSWRTNLNRNGVPDTLELTPLYDGDGGVVGQKVELWEDGQLLWSEEGYYAHAGYNAIFLCRMGQDYLLRYNPYMGQGECCYTYQLFTIENGEETVVEEDSIEFNTHIDSPMFSGPFDPEAINAFMLRVNQLLGVSTQVLNTDEDLLDTFEKLGRLEDDLGWLDDWAPVFVRDEEKSLFENLVDYMAAMEPYNIPTVQALNEDHTKLQLSYHGNKTQFDGFWDRQVQADPAPKVVDLDNDGRDEIVVILAAGHGTGVSINGLYIFDAETLEQFDTSGLTQDIISQVKCTGDKDFFYIQGPGMPGQVSSIPRSAGQYDFGAETVNLGDVVNYTLEDGALYCWLGCDLSGYALDYCGYLKVWLSFDRGSVRADFSTYVPDNGTVLAAYRAALLGEAAFTLQELFSDETGSERSAYIWEMPHAIDKDDPNMKLWNFAVVDFDGDGIEEVLVYGCGVSGDCSGYLLLHYRYGEVYGLVFNRVGWRNHWFMDLKTDGTFQSSDALGTLWNSVSSLRFHADGIVVDDLAITTAPDYGKDFNSFLVDHHPATEAEYLAVVAAQDEKDDAAWFDFQPAIIEQILTK